MENKPHLIKLLLNKLLLIQPLFTGPPVTTLPLTTPITTITNPVITTTTTKVHQTNRLDNAVINKTANLEKVSIY